VTLLHSLTGASCRADTGRDGAAIGPPLEEQVRFSSGPHTLSGTLFRPASGTDHPALVVLAGSDRSARGELRMRVARNFAAHGVAALVYDSPGTGTSGGNALVQTAEDRVAEALSAAAYLRSLEGIRSTAVGLFGGSEGANIAFRACARDSTIAFVIMVSGSIGVPTLEVMRYSAEKRGREQGLPPDDILRAVTFKEIAFALLSGADAVEWPEIRARVAQWKDPAWDTFIDVARLRAEAETPEEKEVLLDSLKGVVSHFQTQPWFGAVDVANAMQRLVAMDATTFFALLESGRYSTGRDDTPVWRGRGERCPLLAIWGQDDSFLPPERGAACLLALLAESGHDDHEIIIFPDASHFLTVPGSSSDFVPGYLDTMTSWLGRHFGGAQDR
jgi:pimeloyl-ACP methyl ester carboxylesterase